MQTLGGVSAAFLGVVLASSAAADEQDLTLAECPAAVRKTLQAEARGARIDSVTREIGDDDMPVFYADVELGGRPYTIGVLTDGTLSEVSLAVDDDEDVVFDRLPAAVQATFKAEAFGARVEAAGKSLRYGVITYEADVQHKGRTYELSVAEDGLLVEKVLVIDDEDVELRDCPVAVRDVFHEHARGGAVGPVTRSQGIGGPTFEAEIEVKGKVYLVEVSGDGHLISKSLGARED